MVSSTSVSGPIQCEVCPPASNCRFWIHPIMWTFTSGQELTDPGAGELLSPTSLELAWSQCHHLIASQWGQPQAKWPSDRHTKHCPSSLWLQLITWDRCTLRPPTVSTSDSEFSPCDRVSQCQSLFFQSCHPAHWHEVAPVLISICL